jgi:O-antigen ligase
MLFAGTVGLLTVGDKLIDVGREDSNGSASHSVYQRESFLLVSLRMTRDYPLWGCGFGRFYDCKLPYLSDRSQQIELESIRDLDHHSTLLSILTETGIVGFTLFAAMLAAWGRAAWQLARNTTADGWMRSQGLFSLAVLLTYLVNAMFHDLTLSPSEQWLLCLTMGATIGLRSKLLVRTASRTTLSERYRSTASSLAPA